MEDFLRCLQDMSKEECGYNYDDQKQKALPEAMIRDYVYNFANHPGTLECRSKSIVGLYDIQETVVCTYTKDLCKKYKNTPQS